MSTNEADTLLVISKIQVQAVKLHEKKSWNKVALTEASCDDNDYFITPDALETQLHVDRQIMPPLVLNYSSFHVSGDQARLNAGHIVCLTRYHGQIRSSTHGMIDKTEHLR